MGMAFRKSGVNWIQVEKEWLDETPGRRIADRAINLRGKWKPIRGIYNNYSGRNHIMPSF